MKNNPKTITCNKIGVEVQICICGLNWYQDKCFLKIHQPLKLNKFNRNDVLKFIDNNSEDFFRVIGGYIKIIDLYEHHGYIWNSDMFININGKLTDNDRKYLLCCDEDF